MERRAHARVWGSGRGAGIDAAADAARGWDHGVFVPLKLAFPAAQLPVVELSVLSSLDPEVKLLVACVPSSAAFAFLCLSCCQSFVNSTFLDRGVTCQPYPVQCRSSSNPHCSAYS